MTEKGLTFYAELEKTWKELADAVHLLTQPTTPTGDNNQQL
jgi:PadR family transcriptional regulator PadR